MIPPRIGLDDENLRTYVLSTDAPRLSLDPPARHDAIARRPFSRMAPRKPDTQWVHFRCVQGQRSRTWGLHLSAPARIRYPCAALCALHGPPMACTRPYAGTAHRECTICSFAVSLSTSRVYRCPLFPRFPPISTVSLITGAIRAARVISTYARTPLSRARDRRTARETLQDHSSG